MKTIIYEGQKYKEFEKETEVNEWALKNYPNLMNSKDENTIKTILEYTGNMYKKYNKALRQCSSIETKEFNEQAKGYFASDGEHMGQIHLLYEITKNNTTPENVIIYRYTAKKYIKALTKKIIIRKGLTYQNKAFISTGLLKQNIEHIKEENNYDTLLKIYVPKGTKGVYVEIDQKNKVQQRKEKEIILKPLTQFEIIKVHHFTKPLLIEVKALPN